MQRQRERQRLLWRDVKRRTLDGDLATSEWGKDPRNQVIEIGARPASLSEQVVGSGERNDTGANSLARRLEVHGAPEARENDRLHDRQAVLDTMIQLVDEKSLRLFGLFYLR